MATESKEAAFICRLEEHGSRLLNNLYFQRNDGKYCDLIIHTPDSSLLVHACVLSSFSSRIASLISRQISRNKIGTLNFYTVEVKFSHDVMESIVTALYTGILQPPENILKDILMAAQWLKIAEIVNVIKKYLVPKQKNKSLVIKPVSKEKACPDVSKEEQITTDGSIEGSSHVSHNSEEGEECGSVYSIDTSSESDSDTHTPNPESNEKQIPNTLSAEISDVNKLNHEMVDANIRIHFNTSDMYSENAVQMLDVKQEIEEPSENDEQMNNSNMQMMGDSSKPFKQVKHKMCQISCASLPKRGRKISKAAVPKDKGNSRKRKIVEEKVKKGKRGRPASGKMKTRGDLNESLETTLIEELHIDDPVKDELDLIVGDMTYIKCTHCHTKFNNLDVYQNHIQNHPTLQCEQCNQSFFSKFALTKHFYSAHIGTEHLVCRHCSFKAKTQIELRKHCSDSHDDRKPFACSREGCMFTARKHHEVLQHLMVHREEREFICDKCSMSFIRQSSLKHHQRACYRLEEFLCDLCGQSFNHIQSMRKHRQVVHFGMKPYKCSICSSSFGDHRNLHRHMRIHDNSFPYACPICKQQFRHSNSLKAHLASRHKDYPEDVQQSLIRSMMNTQGGASYKRNSKGEHSDTESSTGKQDGGRRRKDKLRHVADNMSALPLTFDAGAFPGERYSNFSKSDLDMVVNGKCQTSVPGDRKPIMEDYGQEHDRAVSDHRDSVSSMLSRHLPEMIPVGKMEKIRSHHQISPLLPSSVEHMIVSPPIPHSVEQMMVTTPSVEQTHRLMSSPPHSKTTSAMAVGHDEAQPSTAVAHFHMSEHHLLTPQSSMHKLQQASQQALEKYLSLQRCSIESPK